MRLGLFPAKVQTGDGATYSQVRVYATDDTTELWGLAAGKPAIVATGPGLVKQARGVGHKFTDGTRSKWVLQMADGTEWLCTPGDGCGCSHPLKSFRPERAVRT